MNNNSFNIGDTEPISCIFTLQPGAEWGNIAGELSNQTDLQDALDTLSDQIAGNHQEITNINTTISGYGNIVTHNVSEFATSAQGSLADTALQPGDNITELTNNAGYITSSALPTDYVPETRTINGYALSQNITLNYSDVGALSSLTTINDLTTTAQQNALNSGATSTNIGQIATNTADITTINGKIPSQASSSNQLADKDFVNSSIATNTANFIGTFASVSALNSYSGTVTNNDYAFVTNSVITDNGNDWATFAALDAYNKDLITNFDYAWVINGSNFDLYRFDIINQEWNLRVSNTQKASVTLNTAYNRYKATIESNVVTWEFEYTLNNSSFTAAQWAAINSGITSGDVTLIGTALQPNDNVSSLTNDAGYIIGIAWGDVTGTLSNQTDLQGALDLKYNASNPNGYQANVIETIKVNGTALTPSNKAVDITVPTNNNQLTNGAGYITSASISTLTDVTLTSLSNGQALTYDSTSQKWINSTPASGGGTWGSITGTLSNQTDLQAALDAKQDELTAGDNITITEVPATWTQAVEDTDLGDNAWSALAYDGTKFVALGYSGYISTSTDGTTWLQATYDSNLGYNDWSALAYDGTKFVALGYSGYISTSTDGTTWLQATEDRNLGFNYWRALAYDGTKFVAIGNEGYISTSTDGTTWTQATYDSNLGYNDWSALAYDGTKFVALGYSGYISTSTDGTTWLQATEDSNLGNDEYYWSALTYDGTKFVALSMIGYISTSTDGGVIISATGVQTTSNLVTSVSSASTNSQYPSAKLFYDTCGDIETLINAL